MNNTSFSNSTAICFGDSITWYDNHPYNWGREKDSIAVGYQYYLREAGMSVVNEGISAATLPMIRDHLFHTDIKDYDFILLTSGANDSRYGIPCGSLAPIGSSFDISTFFGCLQSCVEFIQKENKQAEIILMTPLMGWIYAPNGYEYWRTKDGIVEECYADAILQVGELYGCPVCDWFLQLEISEMTRRFFINDPEPDRTVMCNPNPLYSLHPSTNI